MSKDPGGAVEIKVKVATILLKKADPPLAGTDFTLHLGEGTDVEGLIVVLGLPPTLVGSVTINKKRVGRDARIVEGDAVAIIPAISGG